MLVRQICEQRTGIPASGQAFFGEWSGVGRLIESSVEVVAVTGRGEEGLFRDRDGKDPGAGEGERKRTRLAVERRQTVFLH